MDVTEVLLNLLLGKLIKAEVIDEGSARIAKQIYIEETEQITAKDETPAA